MKKVAYYLPNGPIIARIFVTLIHEKKLNFNFIIVHTHLPSFLRYDIFHFSSSKLFQTGCHCLASFSLSVVSSPKQAAVVFTPALYSSQYSTLFQEVQYFLIRSLFYLLYIKHHFPLNKQFSIDSFLDWEGLHWDFSSTVTSPPVSVPYCIHSDAKAMNALI